MTVRKPVLDILGVSEGPPDKSGQLHRSILKVARRIQKFEVRGDADLLVFVHETRASGSSDAILLKYQDTVPHYLRGNADYEELVAGIGNAALRIFPNAFIQSEVYACDYSVPQAIWTSELSATRLDVENILAQVAELLPSIQSETSKECYCPDNALDHKGACSHHNVLANYEHLHKEGARILELEDEDQFQAAADMFVKTSRNTTWYTKLHDALGWNLQDAAA